MADRDPKTEPCVGDYALLKNGARARIEEILPMTRRYGAYYPIRLLYTSGVTRWVDLKGWQRFPGHEAGRDP